MTKDYYFEKYLENSLSNSMSFQTYPKIEKKLSKEYYNDLKEKLLVKYEDKSFNEVLDSKVSKIVHGDVLKISKKEKINFNIKDNDFKAQLNNNLKLLPKIGIKSEQKLKKEGYNTIESLKNHYTHSENASKFLSKIDEMDYFEIVETLNKNKYSHDCMNNILKSISLVGDEDFKFMDIETKGLSNVPIILIGVAEIKKSNIIVSQYFLRDYSDEENIIEAYLSHLDESSVHVTFNGKTFDIPYIKNRCSYYRIEHNLDLPHIDLRYFSKNLWGDKLVNCKLQTIEREIFNINRINDIPGKYIPDFYDTYLQKNNIGPVVPIIEHNAQDIISLAYFLNKMYEEVN